MSALLCILCVFLLFKISTPAIKKLEILFLKRKIKKNPLIGIKDLDGSFVYKKSGYTLRYVIKDISSGQKEIQWVSYKRRQTYFEKFSYKIKILFERFIFYARLKPSIAIILCLIVLIAYIWVIIPHPNKIGLYKFVITSLTGIKPEQIEYKEDGWFELYGKKMTPKDKHPDPLSFTVNPFRWLFFGDYGYVTRWGGKEEGYKTHQLKPDSQTKGSALNREVEITEQGVSVIDR